MSRAIEIGERAHSSAAGWARLLALTHLPEHLALLLNVLTEPRSATNLTLGQWDCLLRSARSARLLGTLAVRVQSIEPALALPNVVRRQFDGALIEARFRRQKLRFLLQSIGPIIASMTPRCVLLKGAAYVMQGQPVAVGRLPVDVDVMVPRDRLDAVESALLAAGWEYEKTDPYDQRYYRKWSHELPPMQCAGQALELDLHHGILPPLGRLRPDPEALLADAVPIEGTTYWALSPVDQALHVAVHLFQDSDCLNRLRDLFDFDALVRGMAANRCPDAVASSLVERAEQLGLTRPLAYTAAFAAEWCDTPTSADIRDRASARMSGKLSSVVCSLAASTLGPPDLDRPTTAARRWAGRLMAARALWLRMPPWLLAYHAFSKALRTLKGRTRAEASA